MSDDILIDDPEILTRLVTDPDIIEMVLDNVDYPDERQVRFGFFDVSGVTTAGILRAFRANPPAPPEPEPEP